MKLDIACLESRWSESWRDERTVEPLLDVLRQTLKIRTKHLSCCTAWEFEHHLADLRCYKSFEVVYCAFHGSPHTLHLRKKHKVSLDDLREWMGSGFEGRLLHLGGCQTTPHYWEKQVRQFLEETQLAAVTGFSRNVDWIESSALELLWFSHIQKYSRLKDAERTFLKIYASLVEKTGFQTIFR